MRWKLTTRFLMTMISIVILVIFANTLMLFYFLFNESKKSLNELDSYLPEQFTRDLKHDMYVDNSGLPALNEEGIAALKYRNIWIQFLDEQGYVINQIDAPPSLPAKYRPIDLVQVYKYREHDTDSTVFVSEFNSYTYMIGIPAREVSRAVITYDPEDVFAIISKYLLYIVIIDLIIALMVGLLFSSILTRPLYKMMDRIQQLKNRNYTPTTFKKTGIYNRVFNNIDDVALELQHQEVERKQLESMRNEWISNVSHDMKTPLASIQGYAELMEDASEDEKVEYSKIIEKKAIYMHELLHDFTLAMRLKNNNMPLSLHEVNFESFIRELIIDFLNDTAFSSRELHFSSSAIQLNKQIDIHLMRRAISNLIVNSFVHNDEQTTVRITLTTDQDKVRLTIEDNGKGMSEEAVARVFERYYRGSYTENVQGTGLGTAIARDIIEAHQGTITLKSELNKGTQVTIII